MNLGEAALDYRFERYGSTPHSEAEEVEWAFIAGANWQAKQPVEMTDTQVQHMCQCSECGG